jgi:hypothetical protein
VLALAGSPVVARDGPYRGRLNADPTASLQVSSGVRRTKGTDD